VKRIAILGSTGSIGTQTLDVVSRFPERFQVVGLAAGRNVELLAQQAKQFRPAVVSVPSPEDLERLRDAIGDPAIRCEIDARALCAEAPDLVVAAQVGSVGLVPVLAALEAGCDVALANKEVLVMAGELVLREARRSGARLLPLDSEHVALAQCLRGQDRGGLKRVMLTASGGPFRRTSRAELARATPALALAHPNWTMGPKISIDSATLMNKGFECIEARWLFDLAPEQIDVVIHPESIIHSLAEYCDGSWMAQLGVPDMRAPIAYTLGLPQRLPLPDLAPLDLVKLGRLSFEAPDLERFPALRIARASMQIGGTAPATLNAANEVAVEAFLAERIPFTAIAELADAIVSGHRPLHDFDLAGVLDADAQARVEAQRWIGRHNG
jgi:1-deoxy-D-xylulose-5-phosphate reductoisomerase